MKGNIFQAERAACIKAWKCKVSLDHSGLIKRGLLSGKFAL